MSLSLRTIVKDKFVHNSLNLRLLSGVKQIVALDKKSIRLGNPEIVQLTGKEDPDTAPTKLGQGRIYELNFGAINSQRDAVIVSVNPALAKTAVVTQPTVIGTKESQALTISLYTIKQMDLGELDWIISLHVLA